MISPIAALRVYRAWHKLTPEQKRRFDRSMSVADSATTHYLKNGVPAPEHLEHGIPTPQAGIRHEMMLACAVTGRKYATLLRHFVGFLRQIIFRHKPYIDPQGDVWGFQKWEQLDAGWLEALAALWENLASGKGKFPFGDSVPPVVPIAQDTVRVAVVGDWGTGEWGLDGARCGSQKVMALVRAQSPDLVIHLGDTYYAGSGTELTSNLLKLWQPGTLGSLALNGNHEMYPGGLPYHSEVLLSPIFELQKGRSFFCLETNTHVLLGLDSSYFADPWSQYLHGKLWDDEAVAEESPQWGLIRAAASLGKPIIVLTHHNPICEDGTVDPGTPLLQQLKDAFAGTGVVPALWYYGHIHMGAVYGPKYQNGAEWTRYRCIGHGALPWSHSSMLRQAHQDGYVEWYERQTVHGSLYDRALNGFAVLELSSVGIQETIYDENGKVSFQATVT